MASSISETTCLKPSERRNVLGRTAAGEYSTTDEFCWRYSSGDEIASANSAEMSKLSGRSACRQGVIAGLRRPDVLETLLLAIIIAAAIQLTIRLGMY